MRTSWTLGAIALTMVTIAGGFYAWRDGLLSFAADGSRTQVEAPPPVLVHELTLAEKEVPVAFDYTATVVSPQIAELKARVTGQILSRAFQPGGVVKGGDLLFQIDPRPFQAALAEADGQRAQAQADLDFASSEVQRFSPLADKGYASDERLEQVTRDRGTAAGRLRQDEASVARQKLNLDYAAVRAPFTGRTGLTDVNVGDLANADQTQLVILAQTDPIQVQVALSPSDVASVKAAMSTGGEPEVQILGADGTPDGRVARIEQFDNTYNPRTSRLRVRASLPNPEGSLAPGQFLRVRLTVGTAKKLLVPTTALSAELNQRVVYAVKDGAVHPQPVETGESYGDNTAVLDGLKPGMRIAIDNLQKLHAGTKVARAGDGGVDRGPPSKDRASR